LEAGVGAVDHRPEDEAGRIEEVDEGVAPALELVAVQGLAERLALEHLVLVEADDAGTEGALEVDPGVAVGAEHGVEAVLAPRRPARHLEVVALAGAEEGLLEV